MLRELRQRRVERGIEDRDVRRRPGSARLRASIASRAGALCSGASSIERGELRHDLVVDQGRLAEARAAVDDAVADGGDAPAPSSSDATGRERSSASTTLSLRLSSRR